MSPEARALTAIEDTQTWKEWCDAASLNAPEASKYLRNRLRAAFLLGLEKGQEIAADRVRDLALGKESR